MHAFLVCLKTFLIFIDKATKQCCLLSTGVLMRIVLYWKHEFTVELLCFRDFRINTMFYFITNVFSCVIYASKTGGMRFFVF